MKYDQFEELCDREWAAGPPFGDVTALSLTDESLAGLSAEAAAAGILVTEMLNPVTRSAVKVTGGAESDTATVSYGTFAWAPPPKTVALA